MKQAEIKVNGYYVAKISGRLVIVRVDEKEKPTSFGRRRTEFKVLNLRTGRVVFLTAAKLRREVTAELAERYTAQNAS